MLQNNIKLRLCRRRKFLVPVAYDISVVLREKTFKNP